MLPVQAEHLVGAEGKTWAQIGAPAGSGKRVESGHLSTQTSACFARST